MLCVTLEIGKYYYSYLCWKSYILENCFGDLLKFCSEISRFHETCLHIAARLGNESVASLLLDHGSDPNDVSQHGTPRDVARKEGHTGIILLLDASTASSSLVHQSNHFRCRKLCFINFITITINCAHTFNSHL
jgi:ankyrin repeat protein